MEKGFTIKEIAEITGKSDTTIYRYLKKGKIPFFTVEKDGQTIYQVRKADLETFLGHTLKENEKTFPHNEETIFHNEKPVTQNEKTSFQFNQETLQDAIFKAISQQQNQLMKPMEEQALYIAGKLSTENQFLKAKVETLLQELEQYKALPLPVAQVTEKLQALESKEKTILLLQKEKEGQIQSMEARHMVELQEREQKTKDLEELHQKEKEEQEARLKVEMEELKKKAEEEQRVIVEAWKKELEQVRKPWWKWWR